MIIGGIKIKKIKALLVIAICLLSCVGVTYAAHYNNLAYGFYHEGDTYNKIDLKKYFGIIIMRIGEYLWRN